MVRRGPCFVRERLIYSFCCVTCGALVPHIGCLRPLAKDQSASRSELAGQVDLHQPADLVGLVAAASTMSLVRAASKVMSPPEIAPVASSAEPVA